MNPYLRTIFFLNIFQMRKETEKCIFKFLFSIKRVQNKYYPLTEKCTRSAYTTVCKVKNNNYNRIHSMFWILQIVLDSVMNKKIKN